MASRSGSKLRTASVLILVLVLLLALVSGILLMVTTNFWSGLITLVIYALLGYLIYVMLQAFAEIADSTVNTAEMTRRILKNMEDQPGNRQNSYQGNSRVNYQGSSQAGYQGNYQGNSQAGCQNSNQGSYQNNYQSSSQHNAQQGQAYYGTTTCPKCGKVQPANRARCIKCGEMLF